MHARHDADGEDAQQACLCCVCVCMQETRTPTGARMQTIVRSVAEAICQQGAASCLLWAIIWSVSWASSHLVFLAVHSVHLAVRGVLYLLSGAPVSRSHSLRSLYLSLIGREHLDAPRMLMSSRRGKQAAAQSGIMGTDADDAALSTSASVHRSPSSSTTQRDGGIASSPIEEEERFTPARLLAGQWLSHKVRRRPCAAGPARAQLCSSGMHASCSHLALHAYKRA